LPVPFRNPGAVKVIFTSTRVPAIFFFDQATIVDQAESTMLTGISGS
jgi:hypothetical protein